MSNFSRMIMRKRQIKSVGNNLPQQEQPQSEIDPEQMRMLIFARRKMIAAKKQRQFSQIGFNCGNIIS